MNSMKKTSPAPATALPRGFRFASVNCGLRKPPALDLGLIVADEPVAVGGVFTQNLVQAAPVLLCKQTSAAGRLAHTRRDRQFAQRQLLDRPGRHAGRRGHGRGRWRARSSCDPEQVLVCSTGVIGVPLKVNKILRRVPSLAKETERSAEAFDGFTRAIMTTDTRPKWASARCRIGTRWVRVLGCAKGAGMIHPNMATMLAYIVTDAAIRPSVLQRAVASVTRTTFNAITVDGDTSTNDTLLVLASGAARNSVIAGPGRAYRAISRGAAQSVPSAGAADRGRWRRRQARDRN